MGTDRQDMTTLGNTPLLVQRAVSRGVLLHLPAQQDRNRGVWGAPFKGKRPCTGGGWGVGMGGEAGRDMGEGGGEATVGGAGTTGRGGGEAGRVRS